ncbi:LysR family transcriptional regulator [Cysteiniphilum sp. JM-1]|uniref:LysR family transcriptional regulator n=1 Tax=Cysteiniphilum sp. JM-1 TaxID=2610891 RepID=UPI0012462C52|nr:LysR family transcriptional regulator [Cysteiniphilum sp. JM-1]
MLFDMRVTLKQLEVFVSFAQCLSFSQTADNMFISQPAVSKIMKQLEEECQSPLVERVNHELYLTPVGKLLLTHARAVLYEVALLKDKVRANSKLGLGEVTLSVHNVLQDEVLLLMSQFKDKYPEVELKLLINSRENQLKQIDDNAADLYMLGPVNGRDDIEQVLCVTTPMRVICAPDDDLAKHKSSINAKALSNQTIIKSEETTTVYQQLDSALRGWEIAHKTLSINNAYSVKEAVKSGLGVAMLPEVVIKNDVRKKELCILDVKGHQASIDFYVMHSKQRNLTPTALALKEFILAYFGQYVEV